jgi:hypothetical protein
VVHGGRELVQEPEAPGEGLAGRAVQAVIQVAVIQVALIQTPFIQPLLLN